MADGYLKHGVDAIRLGHTYRQELGDLDTLCESIQTVGLLHPIVISSDGLLISGRRRLEAVKRLGWREVPVWIAAKVSNRLLIALAVRHENTERKDLTPVEAAQLYDELRDLYADEAARRQAATRFGARPAQETGAVDSTAPQDSRVQAARAITGKDSHGMLDQVLELQRIAADDGLPDWLRSQTEHALTELTVDGKVNGRYLAIKTAQARHELEAAMTDESLPSAARQVAKAEMERLAAVPHPHAAAQAAKRAVQNVRRATDGWTDSHPAAQAVLLARRFAAGVKKHYGWWDTFDPQALAEHLTDEQWDLLVASWDATRTFMRAAIAARQDRHLRTVS